jgi:hypothetical protein
MPFWLYETVVWTGTFKAGQDYAEDRFTAGLMSMLTAKGREGWELVNFSRVDHLDSPNPEQVVFVFKKPGGGR